MCCGSVPLLTRQTSERQLVAKEQGESKAVSLSDETIYRIEIPANRYDLLSTEGLVRALKSYLLGAPCPQYQATAGPVTVQVQPAVSLPVPPSHPHRLPPSDPSSPAPSCATSQ